MGRLNTRGMKPGIYIYRTPDITREQPVAYEAYIGHILDFELHASRHTGIRAGQHYMVVQVERDGMYSGKTVIAIP